MPIVYRAQAEKNGITYIYIGQTDRSLDERRREHERAAGNSQSEPFHLKMREIALCDWKWEILLECDPLQVNAQELTLITKYLEAAAGNPKIIVLNSSEKNDFKTKSINPKPNYAIPKASKQLNFSQSEIGKKFLQISGKLKPVINLKTQQKYDSILEAERKDHISRATIKISCTTGKMLEDGTRYAYLDLECNPIYKSGHKQDIYIGKSARKVKELISGRIFNNVTEAAKTYGLSMSSIGGFANGTYSVAKDQYVFCYLDDGGTEILTAKHIKALEKIKNKDQVKYVAWPVDFTFNEALNINEVGYFKTFDALCEKLNIMNNKGHVKAVCDGVRSHVKTFRIAFYDNEKKAPILTKKHLETSKKIIRRIFCLDDGSTFNNCSEAGYKYAVAPNQIGLCARGILKSVRVQNSETGKKQRLRFAYLDASEQPIIKPKHNEPLMQRKGIPRIVLINPDTIKLVGKSTFSSLAEFCRETNVPHKSANKYLRNPERGLLGYEFIQLKVDEAGQ